LSGNSVTSSFACLDPMSCLARIFISEVLRFEGLGFELVAEDFYKVFFPDLEIGEFDAEALRFRPAPVLYRT
jgi:hypothetical protein